MSSGDGDAVMFSLLHYQQCEIVWYSAMLLLQKLPGAIYEGSHKEM